MAPSLDGIGAAADLIGGAIYAGEYGIKYGAASLAAGVIFAASAWYGMRNVRACRRETDRSVGLLVGNAAMEMRDGGCTAVLETAIKLAQDAPDAYVVFIHDPTFAQCF